MGFATKGITKISELEIDADKDWRDPTLAPHGITNIKQVMASASRGDIVVRGDTVLVRLAAGGEGYVLTSAGPGKIPTWAPAGGALKYYFPVSIDLAGAVAVVVPDHTENVNAPIDTDPKYTTGDDPADYIREMQADLDSTPAAAVTVPDHIENKNAPIRSDLSILCDGFVEERIYDTGSHTAADSGTIMTDAVRALGNWGANELVGFTIFNITDGSSGVITANTINTVTVAALAGGADNTWQAGDTYMVQRDNTANAQSGAAGDLRLEPMSPLLNDKIYIGSRFPFHTVWAEFSQAGIGNWTNAWYYWNGAWVAVVGEDDQSSEWQAAASISRISHTPQGDWVTSTIMGMNLYWLMARCDNFVNQIQAPLGSQMFVSIA